MSATWEQGILRDLHDRYRSRLLGYAVSILRNREDAEDAVQTAFTNALRSVRARGVPENEEAWLFQITRNVCMNMMRTRRRKPASPLDGIDKADSQDAEDVMFDRLHVQAFWHAVERLPENQREAIVLREIRGASYREIAHRLDTSQAAVESLIFRARKGLRVGLAAGAAPVAATAPRAA